MNIVYASDIQQPLVYIPRRHSDLVDVFITKESTCELNILAGLEACNEKGRSIVFVDFPFECGTCYVYEVRTDTELLYRGKIYATSVLPITQPFDVNDECANLLQFTDYLFMDGSVYAFQDLTNYIFNEKAVN